MTCFADGKVAYCVRCPLPSFSSFPSHEQSRYPSLQALRQAFPRDTHTHTRSQACTSLRRQGEWGEVGWGGARFSEQRKRSGRKGERAMGDGRRSETRWKHVAHTLAHTCTHAHTCSSGVRTNNKVGGWGGGHPLSTTSIARVLRARVPSTTSSFFFFVSLFCARSTGGGTCRATTLPYPLLLRKGTNRYTTYTDTRGVQSRNVYIYIGVCVCVCR